MDKNALRLNKQKALIQDTLRAAMKGTAGIEQPVQHPFITAYKTIERELEFMEAFKNTEQFDQVQELYNSACDLEEKARSMMYDGKVTPEGEQNVHLLEFHASMLKIHRIIISRSVEGSVFIPPAPTTLQKQVEKTYDALNQLSKVMTQMSQTPKAPSVTSKKAPSRTRSITSRSRQQVDEPEDPLVLPLRVSPFITEGNKKGTVLIDNISWPRYI
jgi:hypothetical protein